MLLISKLLRQSCASASASYLSIFSFRFVCPRRLSESFTYSAITALPGSLFFFNFRSVFCFPFCWFTGLHGQTRLGLWVHEDAFHALRGFRVIKNRRCRAAHLRDHEYIFCRWDADRVKKKQYDLLRAFFIHYFFLHCRFLCFVLYFYLVLSCRRVSFP